MMDQGVNAAVALRDALNTKRFNLAETLIQKCTDANIAVSVVRELELIFN